VVEPFGLEQQRLAVPLGQCRESPPHGVARLAPVALVIRTRCRVGALGPEQLKPPPLPHGAPAILPDQIQRDGKEPRPRIGRRRLHRPGEGLLRQVLGAVTVAGAAVDHPHQRRVIQLKQLTDIGHVPLKPETRLANWPAPHAATPSGAIRTLALCPATSTASPRPRQGTSSGKARTSAKSAGLYGATAV